MSPKNLEGWTVLDEDAAVLWREYRFGKTGTATTLVFRGADGLVVVSPPTGLDDRELDALKELGPVRALVANNVFHNLGQAAWRKHFPEAIGYAPADATAKLSKKCGGVEFRPLSELRLPDHARCDDAPGMRSGEAIVTVKTAKGFVWYVGDLLANMQKLPPAPVKWLFTMTDSAPGFRLFKLAALVLVKDKKRIRAWMLERLAEAPPSVIVPAHGVPVDVEDVGAQAKTQIERL